MPKKQSIVTSVAAAAAPARAAKPRTTRPAAAKHSKAQTTDPVIEPTEIIEPTEPSVVAGVIGEDRHEQIARIAYGFWEARGYEHGYAREDWLRAEAEYLVRSSN